MKTRHLIAAAAAGIVAVAGALVWAPDAASETSQLRDAASFASIADPGERSAALFVEAGKVLQHPRCVNCHPSGDRPVQGEGDRAHEPPVRRGADGYGAAGMRCATCHQDANFDPGRVPGAPHWQLAPRSMAWEGKSLAEICAQVKDPERNGGKTLKGVVYHMSKDSLVGWAWAPGEGREPAPGSQETLAGLIEAWVESGAVCPE
jgi:hypothetical protein